MKNEEEGLGTVRSCSEIPASNRIQVHDTSFDAVTRHVELRCMHAPSDERVCPIESRNSVVGESQRHRRRRGRND